jgi:hypothetical protein
VRRAPKGFRWSGSQLWCLTCKVMLEPDAAQKHAETPAHEVTLARLEDTRIAARQDFLHELKLKLAGLIEWRGSPRDFIGDVFHELDRRGLLVIPGYALEPPKPLTTPDPAHDPSGTASAMQRTRRPRKRKCDL